MAKSKTCPKCLRTQAALVKVMTSVREEECNEHDPDPYEMCICGLNRECHSDNPLCSCKRFTPVAVNKVWVVMERMEDEAVADEIVAVYKYEAQANAAKKNWQWVTEWSVI